jgi:hypothetical protein
MSLAPKKDKAYYLAKLTSHAEVSSRLTSMRECIEASFNLWRRYQSLRSERGCNMQSLKAAYDQLNESINQRYLVLEVPDSNESASFQNDRGSDSEGDQRESTHQARSSQVDADPSQGQGSVNTGQSV